MQLLANCRAAGVEVVHIRAVYNEQVSPWIRWWRELNPDKKSTVVESPEEFSRDLPGEKVIHKSTFDGFMNTELHDYLQSKGITTVVTAGLIATACVLFTTGGAFFRGSAFTWLWISAFHSDTTTQVIMYM